MITIFDVCNKMKNGIDLFYNMAGGKQIGRKGKNAIIEVLVDNETFQDFAFQKTYGEAKENSKEKIFVLLAIDKEEYDKQHLLLKEQAPQSKE